METLSEHEARVRLYSQYFLDMEMIDKLFEQSRTSPDSMAAIRDYQYLRYLGADRYEIAYHKDARR